MIFQHLNTSFQKTAQDLICCVKLISTYVQPVSCEERVTVAFNRFQEDPKLLCLPVLKGKKIGGLLNRHRFMENHMIGKYGFGHSLNYYRTIDTILDDGFLQVDQFLTIEEVAKLIQTRNHEKLYDDIIVTSEGYYLGIVSVSEVLNAMMENNLVLAIGANPLSGLPGNDFIQRKIRQLLHQGDDFDICYIDIDYFKPYNDRHGFARGDDVIKLVADILVRELEGQTADSIGFAGHIGGDDFILLAPLELSVSICEAIIKNFQESLRHLHDTDEYQAGSYRSVDRQGMAKEFPLLSLSIAIVSTRYRKYRTYAELASVASELKKKAKSSQGSVIVRDKRIN